MNEHSLPRWQACALCLICAATHLLAAPTPARVLLITGIDYPGHKWRETTPVLVEALQQDDRLKIDVLEDPYQLETADLSPYRALFLHFMNWEKPDPGDRAKENLRQFVQNGGGMVMIHFACGAFGDWPEFQNLAGRIYDRVNTHDPRGPFTVNITATKHAITDGIDSFAVDDELYICLTGDKPVHVLATARSKITQRDHPMAFVHEYGKGRVFQTPLGHDVKALQSGRTLELVRRGTLWAAGLDADPPKNKQRSAIEQSFRVPNGFSVRLVAAEPDLANPMSIAVDEQGTLWVTEAHTYQWGPNASPFQPPANPIRRIELDSDNLCLTSTIAMAGFAEPVIGIAVANGKLYATCLNELFACNISPGGQLSDRKVLVRDAARPWNPFGMYRVQIGPDNKLWVSIADHPSTEPVTLTGSDGRQIRLSGQSGGLVRCNRDGSELEIIVHGFRAPYAFDIDPWGHIWQISNGEGSPNLYVHVIPGFDYGYASRRASYSWLSGQEPLSPPVQDMGAGANTAALHYYASAFPRDYWGNVFIANWGSHGENPSNREISRFRRAHQGLDRTGTAGTELEFVEKFLTSTDPRFRPAGLALSPDGGIYVIDWHGRDDENDATGRILKIARKTDVLDRPTASRDSFEAAQAIWASSRVNTRDAAIDLCRRASHADSRARAHALRQLRQYHRLPLLDQLRHSAPRLLDNLPPAEFAKKLLWLNQHAPEKLKAELTRLDDGQLPLVSPDERVATLEAILSLLPQPVPTRFLARMLLDHNQQVQQTALRTVRAAAADHSQFSALTLALAKSGKPTAVRLEAVWTLGALPDAGSIADWITLVNDPLTRTAALRALRQRAPRPALAAAIQEQSKAFAGPNSAQDVALTLQILGASPDPISCAVRIDRPNAIDPSNIVDAVLQRIPNASPVHGRLSFHSQRLACSNCHATRLDQSSFGPNLAGIGSTAQPEYLVESILHPNRVIKTGYEAERIETTDGEIRFGLVEQRGSSIAVKAGPRHTEVIPVTNVHSRAAAQLSTMPEGLADACSTAEFADLVAFLVSLKTDNRTDSPTLK